MWERDEMRSLELGAVYSITTFIRDIRTLLQIRQVAHLMEHYMQPARIIIIIIYYSWNGGRAEAVCAGGKGVRMR